MPLLLHARLQLRRALSQFRERASPLSLAVPRLAPTEAPTTTRTVVASPVVAAEASKADALAARAVAVEVTHLAAVAHLVVAVGVSSPVHEHLPISRKHHPTSPSQAKWHLIRSHFKKSENSSLGVFRSSTSVG